MHQSKAVDVDDRCHKLVCLCGYRASLAIAYEINQFSL